MNPPEDRDHGRFIRNVISIFSKREDFNAPKKIGRLQKFLKNGFYPGLSTDVILESPCFQLREDGEVDRHVFLGVTDKDFIMAAQHLADYVKYPDILFRANVDLDLDGMELACSCPLNFVRENNLTRRANTITPGIKDEKSVMYKAGGFFYRFFLLDEGAHKFVVCTSLGSVWYFEMCNTSDGSDELWTKWREMIHEQDDSGSFGYKTWKVSKEDAMDARKTAYNIEIKDELNFIRRPINFCSVGSVGVQYSDTSLNSGKYRTLKRHSLQNRAKNLAENIRTLRELGVCNFHSDDMGLKSGPKRSNSVASCSVLNNTPEHLSETARIATDNFRSESVVVRSHSECVLGMSESLLSQKRGLHFKYSFLSFISEALPEEPHMAVGIVDIRFGRWGLKRTTLNQLHRIWKLRNVERLEREHQSKLGLSDSDDSITDLFEEFTKRKQRRRPIERWQSARQRLTRQGKPAIGQTLTNVTFLTCGLHKYNAKLWMSGATPASFVGQVTQIHIDLFLKISELDVIAYLDRFRRYQPTKTRNLLQFSRGLSLLIVQEVMNSKNKTERSRRLKFFLQASKECFDLNDLHSTWAVVTGIRLLPFPALREAWSSVFKDHPDLFQDFVRICQLFSHLASHKYRDKLRSSAQQPAYLPWIHHFLWHIRHSMLRPMERTARQGADKPNLTVTKLSRRKISKLKGSNRLKRAIRQLIEKDLPEGRWMALHRELIPSSCLQERFDRQQLSDCKDLESYANVLSSQIIKEVLAESYRTRAFARAVTLQECLGNDPLSRGVGASAKRNDDVHAPKPNLRVKETKHKKSKQSKYEQFSKSAKMSKRNNQPSLADDMSTQQTKEKRKKGFFSRKKTRSEKVKKVEVSNKKETKNKPVSVLKSLKGKLESSQEERSLPSRSADSETKQQHLVETIIPKNELFQERISENLEDQKYHLSPESKLQKHVADPSRRMSKFGAALENDEMNPEKDSVIDKAVQEQLAGVSKGLTLEFILGDGEDDTENFHSKNPEVNTGRTQKVQYEVRPENTNQSHNKENNQVNVRVAKQSTSMDNNAACFPSSEIVSAVSETIRTLPTILKGSNKALSQKKQRKRVSFKDNNSLLHNVNGCQLEEMESTWHSTYRSKSNERETWSSTFEVEDDRNWSSSLNTLPTCCVVCKKAGCIFDGCGLEKLVELQIACLSYRLKSTQSLYSYIEKQSMKLARQYRC